MVAWRAFLPGPQCVCPAEGQGVLVMQDTVLWVPHSLPGKSFLGCRFLGGGRDLGPETQRPALLNVALHAEEWALGQVLFRVLLSKEVGFTMPCSSSSSCWVPTHSPSDPRWPGRRVLPAAWTL